MSREIKRIAVLSSGGDAPGMNSAIRAVVRTAAFHDLHVYGIRRGYEGMIDCDIRRLEKRDVGNILQRGGTVLKTARSERFRTPEGRKSAYESLLAHDIDACIAIGGDGTFTGASIFSQEYDIPFIGIPGTIDNDIYGTDYTIGFDTAVNTAMEAVDKIRDTAESHNRLFFVEVMGRHSGFIALNVGISGGAEMVLLPETDTPLESIVERLRKSAKRKKMFSLVLVAEGNKSGRALEIAEQVKEELDMFDIRTTVVGHLQRGGSPSGFDRVLSSRLGFHAVEGLMSGKENVAVGIINDKIKFTSFEDAINKSKTLNKDLVRMAEILGQ